MTVELVLLPQVSYRGQEITGPRLHDLLALLADDLRTGCGPARLVEGIWPGTQPKNPVKALQILVSRARAQLGADVIASTPIGYRLCLAENQVDSSAILLRASASARHSRAGDQAAALAQAEAGLALWAGTAGSGPEVAGASSSSPLSDLRTTRTATYRSLLRARALAWSRLGRRAEAVEPLAELIRRRPRDEEVLVELLRCEAATIGPATALARYSTYRQALRDELGADPGPVLQGVHQELLRGDPPAVRHGVAHEPNPLLGRTADIVAVTGLLSSSRVTSIVGAGGLGKTRLAQVLSREAEQPVVHFVALAGVAEGGDVVHEVASVLGVAEAGPTQPARLPPGADLLAGIAKVLGPGPALLVLDNCEHVVQGAAELVQALVSRARDLRVLTTSRAPLGLSSESVYLLPELSLPTAMDLFCRRARAARPEVELPAPVVRELCGHLDGLPLAVELAAARVRVMSVTEIARRLDDRFALLRGGARDAPQRHQALHAVIDWSWNLLDPAGQTAMRALSVFPGGFSADAARHLLADDDILPRLEQLVDQSLLKVIDTGSGARFRMLETVREFSLAHRAAHGEIASVTDRFLAWARDFAVAHHESLFGDDVTAPLELIRLEQDNLVLALRQGLERGDGASVAATSAVLGGLWVVESKLTRMATLAQETAMVLSRWRPEPDLVEAVRTAAVLAVVIGSLSPQSRPVRSLVTMRRLPPAPPTTLIRAAERVLRTMTERPDSGFGALHGLCDSDNPLLAGMANAVASYLWEGVGDSELALTAARRMLAAFEKQGTPLTLALAHSRVGELCLLLEQGDEAQAQLGAALSIVRELGAWSSASRVQWAMVLANLQRGAIDEAEHWLERTRLSDLDEDSGPLLFDVGVRAEISLARGEIETGLRLWRRAAARLRNAEQPGCGGELPGGQPWVLEVQAVTVVAHARQGRLELVKEITDDLPGTLSALFTEPSFTAAGFTRNLPFSGALLLALALVDLDRAERTGDPRARRSGVRMIALAESFRFSRGFQPTMSAARVRKIAEGADQSAYAEAVSAWAGLDPEALRDAASAALRARDQFTGSDLA